MHEGLKKRLTEVIAGKYGKLDAEAIRHLSRDSGVAYTTLARFLIYPAQTSTRALRRATLSAVALAVDTNIDWLVSGQGTKQLGFWPILVGTDPEAALELDAVAAAQSALQFLQSVSPDVQIRVCRAVVSAMLEAAVSAGVTMPADVYRCLMRLDAAGRQYVQGVA